MYSVTADQSKKLEISFEGNGFLINGKKVTWDIVKINDDQFHILSNHRSYKATILKADQKNKTFQIKVNNGVFTLEVYNRFDLLLRKMGMNDSASKRSNVVKAPMPGMVLKILVKKGNEVKQGDSLLILEAMKMENLIKAPDNGIIKSILVKEKTSVEKSQVMIEMN